MMKPILLRGISFVIICTLLSLIGCVAPRNVRVAPLFIDDPYWSNVTPKTEDNVLITEGDLLRKYKPIARIVIDSTGKDKSISFERMKSEAAKMGADAVIKIKVSTQYEGQNINLYNNQQMGPRNRHTLEGLAVVYE